MEIKMKRFLIIATALLMTAPALAQNEKFRKIDSLLTYFSQNNKFMGSLAIREKGELVFEKSYGFADADAKVPAKPNTRYKIGSVTKMFTAAIIFQLAEEKKLKLDAKLSEYFPKVKNAEKITIAQLLGHQSGLHNYTDDADFDTYKTKLLNRRDMLLRIEALAPDFEPGTKAEYSNTNYLLLGYIIQDVTGKSFKENVTARITSKLGLKDTQYMSKVNLKKNEAYSYTFDGKWVKMEEWHESSAGAAGALQSTAADLTKFIKALFDGKVVKPESLAKMQELEMGYGKGLFPFPFGERKFLGHSGNIEAFNAVLAYYPKDDMAFSLLVNGDNYNYNEIVIGILSTYYKLPYIFPNFTSVKLEEAVLKRYEGIYSTPSLPFKVDITLKDGELVVHAPEQGAFPINPISETEFNFDPAGITITFTPKGFILKQADGSTTEFVRE